MDQQLKSNIIIGLERISEAFKSLLWEKAKIHGVSPIQIQILLFVLKHKAELCNVSHLAKEFNVTKPTISDAIKILDKKGFVEKEYSSTDSRSYTLLLSESGNEMVKDLDTYSLPLENVLDNLDETNLKLMYNTLTHLIFQLNRGGILTVQRTCFGCRFYEQNQSGHYCHYLKKPLIDKELRLDCPEFEKPTV
ncbi:MAG TPA: helix-turn-helix domain-containing protein [Fulvivirga sp.]|nr:helix-turn-helix domain-containing protein [Fulvivirga sp.]